MNVIKVSTCSLQSVQHRPKQCRRVVVSGLHSCEEPGLTCDHTNLHSTTLTCIAWLQHATLSVPDQQLGNGIPDSTADKQSKSPNVPFPISVFDIMEDVAQV